MADHEIVSAVADALPPGASSIAKLGIAGDDALSKWIEDKQDRFNNLLATAQQINDIIKQINNPTTSADNQFVATQKALGEANAQGHGLAADLQASSALQAASRESENARTDLDARQKAAREVILRQSELDHARGILNQYGPDLKIVQDKQKDTAAADKDEGIILEHDDLQQRIAKAKSQADADAKTHDVDTAAWSRDKSLRDDLTQQADAENSGYQAAKKRLSGEEDARARADKVWSDLEGAKNLITQLTNAVALAQQRQAEINSSQPSPAQSTDAVTGSIQTLQQSFQTNYQTIMDGLKQLNTEIQQSTAEIRSEIRTIQSQIRNHGP